MRKAFLLLFLVVLSLTCFLSCDNSGKEPFVPPEDVDGVQSITVQGHVELWLRGKVLIPYGFQAKLKEDGSSVGSFHAENNHASKSFRWKTELTCELSDPDYTYSFTTRYDEVNKKTVVYLDIDRDIENPAYIQVDHVDCVDVPEDVGFTIWFESLETILNPNATGINRWLGAYTFVNGVDSYTIKVGPDGYRWDSFFCDSAEYPLEEYVQGSDDPVLKAGDTFVYKLRMGSAALVIQYKDLAKDSSLLGYEVLVNGISFGTEINLKNRVDDPVFISSFIGEELSIEFKPVFVGSSNFEYEVTPSTFLVEKDTLYRIVISPK